MTLPILDTLAVWWGERQAGELSIDKGGALHFAYSPDWLADEKVPALSQAMPKQEEPFGDHACKAVFGGLLPEESQRTAIARALGVSPDNPFRLLEALGGDVAGALAFLPQGEEPLQDYSKTAPEPLHEGGLAELLDRLPSVPMLAGEGGARLSLAGAQSKLPVVLTTDGGIAIPRPGEPSTHLIKPEPDRFPGLAANEAFCLALARALGIDAAHAEWRTAAGKPFLLVERYDRISVEGTAHRLHQEDFAQALGVPSNRKYAAEGGPTFRDSFALLRSAATRPAREVLKLADAAIFNLIIGNADAHAKNYSLLRLEAGEVVLAPLYDLVATHMWKELSPKLAMRFGRAATLEEFDGENVVRFAEEAGLGAPYIRRRIGELAQSIVHENEKGVAVPGYIHKDSIAKIAECTVERAKLAEYKL
ncbi:phosphatidylinositol kinase [Erythrobacter sp. KY5]|uniref:type II toxin-antitoxin system HipA family toxin n=1 Tax=Erythrobacter sp. KY5 TaxID=2011159 RepID=UPI000DBF230E|nr:type II toxin-antitoxin system HipA family toxin [Erythrobacter sp. KY5]AWW72939.1 phosphatidylinositol kinase [Erythrobacter sp. KY5]